MKKRIIYEIKILFTNSLYDLNEIICSKNINDQIFVMDKTKSGRKSVARKVFLFNNLKN